MKYSNLNDNPVEKIPIDAQVFKDTSQIKDIYVIDDDGRQTMVCLRISTGTPQKGYISYIAINSTYLSKINEIEVNVANNAIFSRSDVFCTLSGTTNTVKEFNIDERADKISFDGLVGCNCGDSCQQAELDDLYANISEYSIVDNGESFFELGDAKYAFRRSDLLIPPIDLAGTDVSSINSYIYLGHDGEYETSASCVKTHKAKITSLKTSHFDGYDLVAKLSCY